MPINDRYPIEEVLKGCQEYQKAMSPGRYITFEYLMLKVLTTVLTMRESLSP